MEKGRKFSYLKLHNLVLKEPLSSPSRGFKGWGNTTISKFERGKKNGVWFTPPNGTLVILPYNSYVSKEFYYIISFIFP